MAPVDMAVDYMLKLSIGLVWSQHPGEAVLREEVYVYYSYTVAFFANTSPVEPETAPSGMLARGHYNATSRFVDDDNETHLQFKWSFDIKKDW